MGKAGAQWAGGQVTPRQRAERRAYGPDAGRPAQTLPCSPAHTLICGLWPPPMRVHFCRAKSPSLWGPITAAMGHRLPPSLWAQAEQASGQQGWAAWSVAPPRGPVTGVPLTVKTGRHKAALSPSGSTQLAERFEHLWVLAPGPTCPPVLGAPTAPRGQALDTPMPLLLHLSGGNHSACA